MSPTIVRYAKRGENFMTSTSYTGAYGWFSVAVQVYERMPNDRTVLLRSDIFSSEAEATLHFNAILPMLGDITTTYRG